MLKVLMSKNYNIMNDMNHLEGSMSMRDYVASKGAASVYKIFECKAQDGTIFKQVGFFIDKDYEEGQRNEYCFLTMSKQLSKEYALTDNFLQAHASELRVVETTSDEGRTSATMYLPGDGSRTSRLHNLVW